METSEEELTYTDAVNELEQIITEMEDASIGVDELTDKVKRASMLLQFCRNKLTTTEQDVNNILRNFDKEN
jgi:exodeoxyribonuclease VII small subunit